MIKKGSKICPDNKEINPVTGRFVLKCKEGTVRNKETGKCDKIPSENKNNVRKGRPKKLPDTQPVIPTPQKPKKSLSTSADASDASAASAASAASSASVVYLSPPLSDDREFELYYPDLDDTDFTSKITNNKEFLIHKIPDYPIVTNAEEFNAVSTKLCGKFDKMLYQHFIGQFLSYRTPYRSALLYHGVGVGKTCSAITITEALLSSQVSSEPMIWVIMPQALKTSFKSQVFSLDDFETLEGLANQCTDHNYIKLLNIYKSTLGVENKEKLKSELKALLKTRYDIFTYDRFAKYIKDNYTNTNKIVENKVIIIDEAHNIRSTNKKVKDTYVALMNCLEKGKNNRLVLLSATPMYNEPRDILELLKLLLINDKRHAILQENKKIFNSKTFNIEDANVAELIRNLSGRYISYLKGKNPFSFALKLNPSISGIKVLEKAPTRDMTNKAIKKESIGWLKNIDDEIVISTLGEAQKKLVNSLEKIAFDVSDSDGSDVDGSGDDAMDSDGDVSDDDDKQNNNMKLLQPMNIVYDTDIGIKGFYNFFSKTKDTDPIELKYTEGYKNALLPDKEHLGKYAGKFLNVCNFIRKSKGIVVIYSRFLISGIIPIAICLEHLGYSREGANNILKNADIVKDKPIYEGVRNPKYCILTSDKKEYMGTTKIDDLIKIINSEANHNGAKIKVILITPVASEGLSFFNTREIHLIEPWYHFNRADQIIGRGIRNCRHNSLAIENRNVSVFMHASVNDDESRESIDINAFRISTRKYIESKKVDKIIMDNAIDCHLMKNINYFPKTLFKMDNVNIQTSQGAVIKYNFGDDDKYEPKCNVIVNPRKINTRGYRSEIYKHLLPSIKTMIKNIISTPANAANTANTANTNIYFDFEMLKNSMGNTVDNDILMYAIKNILYPSIFIRGKYITRYKNGILISPIDIQWNTNKIIRYNNASLTRLTRLTDKPSSRDDAKQSSRVSDSVVNVRVIIQKLLDKIDIDFKDINKTAISIYLNITAEDFKVLIQYILKSYPESATDAFDKNIHFISKCLYKQGILIKSDDIPSYSDNNNEYIGYINMYSENNEVDNTYIQYNENDKKVVIQYRSYPEYIKMIDEMQVKKIRESIKLYNATTQSEQNVKPTSSYMTEYFSNRVYNKQYIPNDMTNEKTPWGIIVRSKNKYILKLFTTGDGKKTGRVCDTYTEEEHNTMLRQLIPDSEKIKMKNKKILCSHIANILLLKNKLILYPLYKPKS
jgi:hypothetical protein